MAPNQTRPEYRAVWTNGAGETVRGDGSLNLDYIKSVAEEHKGTIEVSHGSGWQAWTDPDVAPEPAPVPAPAPSDTPPVTPI